MAFTCTLCSRTSSAKVSASRTTAALDAEKTAKFGRASAAPGPLRMMIFPERRSTICGRTARQACMTPKTLVSRTSVHCLGFSSENGPIGPCTAAAAMSTCTPPNTTRMRSTAALSCSKSRTSARMRNAAPPACSISSLVASSSAWLRDSSPTRAPACANPRASRLPMPRPAPVIRTPWSLSVRKRLFYARIEDSGFYFAGALHLDENPVAAGLREAPRKGDLSRHAATLHRVHASHAARIWAAHLRRSHAHSRHGRRSGGMHVGEDLEIIAHERRMARHAHVQFHIFGGLAVRILNPEAEKLGAFSAHRRRFTDPYHAVSIRER